MTEITLRQTKGAPLTHDELDANFSNLKETADLAYDASVSIGGKATAAVVGVDDAATDLGTFTGSTISDNATAKGALQELETALESTSGDAATKTNATAIGIAATDANMGTTTGTILSDNGTAKDWFEESEAAIEGKVDPDLDNADFTYPNAGAAPALPFYNFRTQKRNLADFIDKDLWADCRAGTPSVATTNGLGQDSLAAAIADMAGAVGGEVIVPDGYFRIAPLVITQSNFTLRGRGRSSTIQTTSATAHQVDINAPLATIADLDFVSTVARTAGACVNVRPTGSRFHGEGLLSRNAFTLLKIGDIASGSQGGIFTAKRLRAEDTVLNGHAYIVEGGYVVTLDDIIATGDPLTSALLQAATGLRVLRCADLRVGTNSQFINCQRPLDIYPPTGASVDSFRMEGGYCGTSYYGSRASGGDGGTINSLQAKGVWFGENKDAGGGVVGSGPGLSLLGAAAGRLRQATLIGCEFPLAQSDGLRVDQYATDVQVIGGWADGCDGAGYSFNGTSGFSIIGARSGAQRFTGNAYGYYIDGACDNFYVDVDARGNTSTPVAPAPSSTKLYNPARMSWASFTPTVTSTSGTITTASATCRYKRVGTTVEFSMEITVTTNGTGAGALRVTMPFTSASGPGHVFVGRDTAVGGKSLTGTMGASFTTMDIRNYDNSYPAANGSVIVVSGTYQAA